MKRLFLCMLLVFSLLLAGCNKTIPASEMEYQKYSYEIGALEHTKSVFRNITETAVWFDQTDILLGTEVITSVPGYSILMGLVGENRDLCEKVNGGEAVWKNDFSNFEMEFPTPQEYYMFYEDHNLAVLDIALPNADVFNVDLVSQRVEDHILYVDCVARYAYRGSRGYGKNIGCCFFIPVDKSITNVIASVDMLSME